MSEFYYNLSSSQIQDLINKKLSIYGNNFDYAKFNGIEIRPNDFVYEALADNYAKQGINFNNFKLYKYVGVHLGTEVYHFFIISYQNNTTKYF